MTHDKVINLEEKMLLLHRGMKGYSTAKSLKANRTIGDWDFYAPMVLWESQIGGYIVIRAGCEVPSETPWQTRAVYATFAIDRKSGDTFIVR